MIRRLAQIAALCAICAPSAAVAQDCFLYADVAAHLEKTTRQYLTMTMLTPSGGIIEIWHNADNQTWTAISVLPDGVTCFLAQGTGVMFSIRPNT